MATTTKITALCIKCGEQKAAPLVPCPACQFAPVTAQDKMESVSCSSTHQLQAALAKLQEDIRAGIKIEIPPPGSKVQTQGSSNSPARQPSMPKYELPEDKIVLSPRTSKVLKVAGVVILVFLLKWLRNWLVYKANSGG